MALKLAVTLSGAVSLGSYEAGVLYEVLHALKEHNLQPGISEDQKIYIDVLTGASAGGLSATLAAQKLLYEADALEDPYNNALYNAWVADIGIDGLLNLSPDEPANCSIFSSDLVDKLAHEYLMSRYAGTPPPANTHAAVGPDGMLHVGLALSNLCGVDYTHKTLGGELFTYTRFQDEFTASLGLTDDSPAGWCDIQRAAVSCGAFPFAFRVQDLARDLACYDSSSFFNPTCFGGQSSRSFTYTDGGVFQNEPLGLAKNLIDAADQHLGADQRAYLFIAPDAKQSTADDSFCSKVGFFNNVASRLISAILNQSRFQDWIQAEKVNRQVAVFNSHATGLHELFAHAILTPEILQPVLGPIVALLFPPDKESELATSRARLRQQFSLEYEKLVTARGNAAAEFWIDTVLLFETAAHLHSKEEMYIYAITAASKELAGSPLMSFLGFFDRRFRDHDYDIGRIKAQAFLRNPGGQGPLSILSYTAHPIRPLQPGLTGLSIQQVPVEQRKQLGDRLKDRAAVLLKELGLSFLVRRALQFVFINRKINEFLGL